MARYIKYLRVSTKDQGRSGLGLEAQENIINTYLSTTDDAQVVETYKEIESGKREDRPQLLAALKHCKAIGAELLVAKVDRVGRRAHQTLEIFNASGVRVVNCINPHASQLEIGVTALFADQEGRDISARTKAALAVLKARGVRLGNPNGARALNAYTAMHGNVQAAEGARRAADAFADDCRQWIESAITAGAQSANAIAKHLNSAGIKTRRGGKWSHKQVGQIMDRLDLAVA